MNNQPQDVKTFDGVMDQDSALWNVGGNNCRNRLNLVNIYNQLGSNSDENVRSNVKVINNYLTISGSKVIGAFEDVRDNSVIFFLYSPNKLHGIFRWFQNKGTDLGEIQKIYQVQDANNDPLNFDPDYLITGCSLVDNQLYWVAGNNPPMSIDTIKANQTNKNKWYNLYFDDRNFGVATTYTVSLYEPNIALPIFSFTYTSSGATYADQVNDLQNYIRNNQVVSSYFLFENKVQYALLGIIPFGDYNIAINDAYLVAENFYPDVTPTTVSYAPLNQELITAVKYPPMCEPKAEYGSTLDADGFRANYFGVQNFYPSSQEAGYVGLATEQLDTGGYVILGNTLNFSIIFPPFLPMAISYITNPTANPLTFNVNIDVNFSTQPAIQTQFNPNLVGRFKMIFGKRVNATTPIAGPILYNEVGININTITSRTFNFSITIQPSERWVLFLDTDRVDFAFSTAISASVVPIGLNTDITSNAYQFRAKYIYDNFEQSVYGAISNIPLPISKYQDIINIDYTDPRLESLELSSAIREVVLCLSYDNGTTWFDFKRLQPFEFVGQGRQKYVFNGKEALLAVAEAEAILPYHNMPLTADSQEFIDDRLFYGSITTGYDKIAPNITQYVDYIDPSSIPNVINSLPPYSVSYWRRGGEYSLGIVYYDDADRRSPAIVDPINSRIKIPFYTQDTGILGVQDRPATINMSIFHEPPSWADKYQLVRTRDLSQITYLQWTSNGIAYEDINGATAPMASAAYLIINIENITFYQDKTNIGSKIAFPYVNGDRVRFIKNRAGVYYNFNDHEIIKVDGQRIYIINDGSILTSDTTADTGGDWLEFYSPNVGADDTVFYEFGECYPILEGEFFGIKRKYHAGNDSDQNYLSFGVDGTPAINFRLKGDVFYRTRNIPYQAFITPPSGPTGYTDYFMSANTPSEYIEDTFYNNGRVNSSELLGRIYQPTGLVFTDQYISGTKINGLNAVQPLNTRQYSTIYGRMAKMQVINNDILRLIFANGWMVSIYVGQGVIRQGQGGENLISVVDDVAGNSHIIQRTLGSSNGESVALNDEGDLFGWDSKDGTVWLSSSSQTVAVSDFLMKNTFNNYGIQRRALDQKKSQVLAIYDLGKDLYTITFNPLEPRPFIAPTARVKLPNLADPSQWVIQINIEQSIYSFNVGTPSVNNWYSILLSALPPAFTLVLNADGSFDVKAPNYTIYNDATLVIFAQNISSGDKFTYNFRFEGGQEAGTEQPFEGVTLAFSRKRKGWLTYFSFIPEFYSRLGNQLISFKDGEMWLHDRGADYNNFYGVQYGTSVKFVLNKDYPKVKVPLSVWYRGIGRLGCRISTPPTDSYPTGAFTEMLPEVFTLEDNGYYSEVFKNKLDPNFTDPNEAWINGDDVRGDVVEVELYSDENSLIRLDSQRTLYLYSENS